MLGFNGWEKSTLQEAGTAGGEPQKGQSLLFSAQRKESVSAECGKGEDVWEPWAPFFD